MDKYSSDVFVIPDDKKTSLPILPVIILIFSLSGFVSGAGTDWLKKTHLRFSINYTQADSNTIQDFEVGFENGIKTIEKYFQKQFPLNFEIYLFASRKALEEQWRKDWHLPDFKSECWMVASGVAHRLDFLSLNRWGKEACEHDAKDKTHIQKIITHELVHVFHGQNNPVPDFSGMDDIGWFVEGLAVLVSGQLDSARIQDLSEAKKLEKLPSQLKNAWSGKYQYAVCGSIVNFIQTKYGNQTILKLLSVTTETEILRLLQCTEAELLSGWESKIEE